MGLVHAAVELLAPEVEPTDVLALAWVAGVVGERAQFGSTLVLDLELIRGVREERAQLGAVVLAIGVHQDLGVAFVDADGTAHRSPG